MTPSEEMRQLAAQLEAIGYHQMDNVQTETVTGRMFVAAAKWLKKASSHICGGGYFGCSGGPNCSSDHK